ncbi:DUF2726 domain-containing protein [Shewanella colwelliana]|uniref:DUF2726 domain-containing protein n=1 Tax=Shewanella colwelliana TaxID=23 RepID=UPI0022B011BE|nr:DUF2726 domain-containing protein [Shewanella colwelliana]MCZ4337716.1 DUF2726 domain-containing protein [Shewanella colwelliana]
MERFYSLMGEKRWADIFKLTKTEQSSLKRSEVEWANVCKHLEAEFIRFANEELPVLVSTLCREYIRLHSANYLYLSSHARTQIEGIGLEAYQELSHKEAVAFARICTHSNKAAELLVEPPLNAGIKASFEEPTKKAKFSRVDWLQPLFKSDLESEFYQALKDVFPSYFIYPNVVLSNIFDFDMIREHLAQPERDFYFKGIVDFVVFDPADNHNPKYFFEVDSHYHDDEDARRRDKLKNNIFYAANIPLHRVRADTDSLTTAHDFKVVIRNLIR